MTEITTVDFIYTHLGSEYHVDVTFQRDFQANCKDGPHDNEWTIRDIDVVGPDGNCWYGEFRGLYTRKTNTRYKASILFDYITVASVIRDLAYSKIGEE